MDFAVYSKVSFLKIIYNFKRLIQKIETIFRYIHKSYQQTNNKRK